MPATEWSQLATSELEFSILAETALTGVAITMLTPGLDVEPVTLEMNYFRPAALSPATCSPRQRTICSFEFLRTLHRIVALSQHCACCPWCALRFDSTSALVSRCRHAPGRSTQVHRKDELLRAEDVAEVSRMAEPCCLMRRPSSLPDVDPLHGQARFSDRCCSGCFGFE
jgi:hypothetical protein